MNILRRLLGGFRDAERGTKMTGLEAVQRVLLPQSCADATQAHLRTAGQNGNEGLVVWSGVQDGDTFRYGR